MVTFSGWSLPVQYDFNGALAERCRGGVMAEHLHCRTKAALFDVSHMGQAVLEGVTAPAALERLVPGDIAGLKPYRQRYTLLMNEAGGIIDDLMVANLGNDRLFLVVNAARRGVDLAASRGVAAQLGPADRTRGSRPAGLAGTGSGLGHGGARSGGGRPALHGRRSTPALPVCRVRFHAPATPGEDGFEISVPSEIGIRLADRLIGKRKRCSGWARRTGFAAAGGRTLPLWQRH